MAENILDGTGSGYLLKVNSDGSINTITNIGSISFSGTIIVDDVNGTMFMVSGNAWTGVGSTYQTNFIPAGSESWIKGGSIQPYDPIGIGSSLITNFPNYYLGSECWNRGMVSEDCGSNTFIGSILANGSYVGSWENTLNYSAMNVFIKQSAVGSLYVENSMDGINIDRSTMVSPSSGIGTFYSLAPRGQYFRLRYMNGPDLNNPFRLQTVCSPTERGASYLPVNQAFSDNFTVLSTRSVLTAKSPAGSYVNIDCTTGGNLKMSIEDWNGVVGSVYLIGIGSTLITSIPKTEVYTSGIVTISGNVGVIFDSDYVNVIQSGTNWNVLGSQYIIDTPPTSSIKYNPKKVFIYSGTTNLVGSIYEITNTGSYLQVITYDINDNITNVSAWSSV